MREPSGINHFEFQFSVSTTENFIPELRIRSKTMQHITAFRREKEVSQARNSNLVHFVAKELPFETCPTDNIEKAGTEWRTSQNFGRNVTHQSNRYITEFHPQVMVFIWHHALLCEEHIMQIQRSREIIILRKSNWSLATLLKTEILNFSERRNMLRYELDFTRFHQTD